MGYSREVHVPYAFTQRMDRRQALRRIALAGSGTAAFVVACSGESDQTSVNPNFDTPSAQTGKNTSPNILPPTPSGEKRVTTLGGINQGLEMLGHQRAELSEPLNVPFHSDKLRYDTVKPPPIWTLENYKLLSDFFVGPETNGYKPAIFFALVENFSGEDPEGYLKFLASQTRGASGPDTLSQKMDLLREPMVGMNGLIEVSNFKTSKSHAQQVSYGLFHSNKSLWNIGLRSEKSVFPQNLAILEQMLLALKLPQSK